uniref:Glycosyltransferase family 92 protein n=1 Tax=Panagrolaimus sp. PS1159 TaxID=55785 RepID=A0AC35FGU4_9BILA
MKKVMNILKIYEKKNWLKIQEFVFYDFDKESVKKIGFHPSKELLGRNLLTSSADCVMRYRESSEFIISADIDDILFPKEKNYYEEFLKWTKKYPDAPGFIYPRIYGKIDTPNDFQNFSLSAVIESIKMSNEPFMGKPILRTDRAETPWIHWLGLSKNGDAVDLDQNDAIMAHVQISAEKVRAVKSFGSFGENENLNTFKSFNPIPKNEIAAINENFIKSFENITNFVSNFVYADIIFGCFKDSEHWNQDYCYTQFRCKLPKNVTNFECETVRRNISVKTLNKNSVFYIPKNEYFWIKSKDNCKLFD